jgi:hypothetical protein
MKHVVRFSSSALATGVLLAAVAAPAEGQGDFEGSRRTLEGLDGVHVWVEEFEPEARRAGFDKDMFKAAVEMKLRSSGIEVLTEDEVRGVPGVPVVYLVVQPIHATPGEIAPYSIEIQLHQLVYLGRDPTTRTLAATWGTAAIGEGNLPYVQAGVMYKVGQFVSAWRSVNPR